jgi:predicted MFS family arabinose efflux permease
MTAKKRLGVEIFLLGFLAFWANGDNYAAAPLLVKIASEYSVDLGTAALNVTAYMLFFGLFTIFFGPLGDRYGRARILKVAAFGSAILGMLTAFAWDLPSLIAFRALNGGLAAGIMPLAVAYAGESTAPEEKQNRIGQVMGMMFLGGALATVIGGAIAYFGSWKALYFVYGVAELTVAIPVAFLLRDSGAGLSDGGVFASFKELFSSKSLLKTIGLLFFVGFSTMGAFAYFGKYVQDGTSMNLMLVGCVLSAYGIGTMVGGRLAGRIRAALGDRFFFLAVGAGGGAALFIFGLIKPVPLVAVPALIIYGFAFICIQSSVISSAQELMPNRRGTVMSAASFTMVVSGALGTLVNGKILAISGFSALILIAGLAFLIAGILAASLIRASRRQLAIIEKSMHDRPIY